jgi:predicted esterase
MKSKPLVFDPLYLTLTVLTGVILAAVFFLGLKSVNLTRQVWTLTGKLVDQGSTLVYLPNQYLPGRKVPLVFALSPGADAYGMISTWAAVAEKHNWIIAASKTFQNGQDFLPSLKEVEAQLNRVETAYAIDLKRVIFTGISGGGMGSHAFARFYPERVSAVVINTGMMEGSFAAVDYPTGKLAVMLASPTDFRYTEMKRDRLFLESHNWHVDWIEFPGGHTFAPPTVYEQAAAWLEQHLLP